MKRKFETFNMEISIVKDKLNFFNYEDEFIFYHKTVQKAESE